MNSSRIRLVYCESHKQREIKPVECSFKDSKQLNLFDEIDKIRMFFIPVSNVSAHSFMKVLHENSPYLVLDTRDFPDFFSVFVSTSNALAEFERRGIHYQRLPIHFSEVDECTWQRYDTLKSILLSYIERKTSAPILVLSSTRTNVDKISEKIKGYVNQEIKNAQLETIIG